MIILKVDYLIGFCAQCGLPCDHIFCDKNCEQNYLTWRLEEESATKMC